MNVGWEKGNLPAKKVIYDGNHFKDVRIKLRQRKERVNYIPEKEKGGEEGRKFTILFPFSDQTLHGS